jgi:hypothetical protein
MKRIFIPLSGLLLFVGVAHGMTLAEIETQIRRNVRDTSTTVSLQRYSDTSIDNLINEGQRVIVNQTWCLDSATGYVLTSGTSQYVLPDDFLAVKYARFKDQSNNTFILEEKNERSFIITNPTWEKQGGKPVQYFVRSSTSTGTPDEISYYPIPNTTSSTGTVTIDYYKQATDMTTGTDVPFDGLKSMIPYHYSLVDYVTMRILLLEGNSNEATLYNQMFSTELAVISSKFGSKPNWSPSFSAGTK